MRKKMCVGFGIALFGIAALLFVAGNTASDPGYRVVQSDEASLIMGGGQPGASYSYGLCGGGSSDCHAAGLLSSGTGTQRATGISTCGGSCGNVVNTLGDVPE